MSKTHYSAPFCFNLLEMTSFSQKTFGQCKHDIVHVGFLASVHQDDLRACDEMHGSLSAATAVQSKPRHAEI